MGRTLPSISIVFFQTRGEFKHYRSGLARRDQLLLDELFVYAQHHLAEAAYASSPEPIWIFILAMLLEEHKEVMRLREFITAFIESGISKMPGNESESAGQMKE
jgi:hypothetical protein